MAKVNRFHKMVDLNHVYSMIRIPIRIVYGQLLIEDYVGILGNSNEMIVGMTATIFQMMLVL